MRRIQIFVLLIILFVPFLVNAEDFHADSYQLIREGKLREALDALVKATEVEPNNRKVYATLSLLYQEVGECALVWKYFLVAQDLGHRDRDLERGVKSLCKKPREKQREEMLEFEKGEKFDILTIQFSPEQQQWSSHAKLPLFTPSNRRTYCELTLSQTRKLRELSGRTIPWLVIDAEDSAVIISGDRWITVVKRFEKN